MNKNGIRKQRQVTKNNDNLNLDSNNKYTMRKRMKGVKNYSEDSEEEVEEETLKLSKKRKRGVLKIKRGINCSWTEEEVIIKS